MAITINTKNAEELRQMQNEDNEKTEDQLEDQFDADKKGRLMPTSSKNAALILENDKNLNKLVKYNEFTQDLEVSRDQVLPMPSYLKDIHVKKGEFTDTTLNQILLYIGASQWHVNFKQSFLAQVMVPIAHIHSFNPVKDYMDDALKNWDGKKRIDNFLQVYLGAENTKANKLSFRLWLMGAVGKVYNPLIKFDYVLDLVGGQGVGKTTLLSRLAPLGYYTDEFNGFTDRDDKARLKNALIANDDEMTATNRSSFEEIKKFITDQVFQYRPPYGHYNMKFHKGFVLARTSNEIQHLKDKSGDRRFLCIECNKEKRTKSAIDEKQLTDDEIKQLWGEAVHDWKAIKDAGNSPYVLTKKQEKIISNERTKYLQTSEVEDIVCEMIENQYQYMDFVSTATVMEGIKERLSRHLTPKDSAQARYVMVHNGFVSGARGRMSKNDSYCRGFANKHVQNKENWLAERTKA